MHRKILIFLLKAEQIYKYIFNISLKDLSIVKGVPNACVFQI